jgi:hypothetical protein
VVLFYDGSEYWVGDGFHRIEAYRRAIGGNPNSTPVRAGSRRDAILYAAGANASHGLRRTQADKRRSVETLLMDAEWAKWSDREIARQCKVSADLVGAVRKHVVTVGNDSERTYTTKHGTTATMNTTGQRDAAQRRPSPQRDDAADDAWRPPGVGARVLHQETPAGRPMIEVLETAADPYRHPHGDAIRNDMAARDSDRIAAADMAFGLGQPRHTALAAMLQQVLDVMPELTRLSGNGADCIMLAGALTRVHAALIASAAPTPPPAAPATELPADLLAHGWALRQARQGGMWFAAITPPDEEREITTVKRGKIDDVIGDARYMERTLRIGVQA